MRIADVLGEALMSTDTVWDRSTGTLDLRASLGGAPGFGYRRDFPVCNGASAGDVVVGVLGPDPAMHGSAQPFAAALADLPAGTCGLLLFGYELADLPLRHVLDLLAAGRCGVRQVVALDDDRTPSAVFVERVDGTSAYRAHEDTRPAAAEHVLLLAIADALRDGATGCGSEYRAPRREVPPAPTAPNRRQAGPGPRLPTRRFFTPPTAGADRRHDVVLAGIWRTGTAETLAPDCGVETLRPHDGLVVLEQSNADILLIETAATLPGHPWAYLGSRAAPALEHVLLSLIDLAHAQARAVVLWDNLAARCHPGVRRLAGRCDLVVGATDDGRYDQHWSPGVQLRRYNPIDRLSPSLPGPTLWLRPAEVAPTAAALASIARTPAPEMRSLSPLHPAMTGSTVADLGWRNAPAAFRRAAVVVSPAFLAPDAPDAPDAPVGPAAPAGSDAMDGIDLDTLHAAAAACGARVVARGAAEADPRTSLTRLRRVARVQDVPAAVADGADLGARDLLPVLREMRARFGTRGRLRQLQGLLGPTAGDDPAEGIAVLALAQGADPGALVDALAGQSLRPRELILGRTSAQHAGEIGDRGVEKLRSLGVRVRQEVVPAGPDFTSHWSQLATCGTSRWASVWDGAAMPGRHLLLDAVVAWECSRADVIARARLGDGYVFTHDVSGDPVLIERERLVDDPASLDALARRGTRVFGLGCRLDA